MEASGGISLHVCDVFRALAIDIYVSRLVSRKLNRTMVKYIVFHFVLKAIVTAQSSLSSNYCLRVDANRRETIRTLESHFSILNLY